MQLQTGQIPRIVPGIDRVLKLAAKGDLPAVKRVLAADPGMLNAMSGGHHRTFLWEAANANRLAVVEYLVELGANVNIPGRYRSQTLVLLTPYCIAVKRKRKDIADYLLQRGTVIDIYSAAFLGDLARLKKWLDKDKDLVNVLHPEDSAWDVVPLHYAVAGEQLEAADYLVRMKTDVVPHAGLLLDMACRLGRMDLIRLLVGAGADPAAAPVFSVVYTGCAEIMAFFFSRGVDVNKKGNTGWPPIAYISRGDKGEHPDKVRALLKYGAEVNASGPKGVTALHAAAKAGFVRVIAILLQAGADINAKTNAGQTPLQLASRHKRTAAADLLETNGAGA